MWQQQGHGGCLGIVLSGPQIFSEKCRICVNEGATQPLGVDDNIAAGHITPNSVIEQPLQRIMRGIDADIVFSSSSK